MRTPDYSKTLMSLQIKSGMQLHGAVQRLIIIITKANFDRVTRSRKQSLFLDGELEDFPVVLSHLLQHDQRFRRKVIRSIYRLRLCWQEWKTCIMEQGGYAERNTFQFIHCPNAQNSILVGLL
jgi:hypothetical protein